LNNDEQQLAWTLKNVGETARLETRVKEQAETIIRLTTENERLKAALKPFVDAANQIPKSLSSCLWFWNGSITQHYNYTMLSGATTDDLLAARDMLIGTSKPDEMATKEIEANKRRRGERMTQLAAEVKATAAAERGITDAKKTFRT
jgi:hypothetical protein